MMPGSGSDVLRTTGGQIDGIVLALIEASYDKNELVTASMCKSLFCIGKHQPNLVLTSCLSYLRCHSTLPLAHKILVLTVMEQICTEALKSIKKNVALEIIKVAVDEMVTTKEIVPEWQNVASGILVSLGRSFHYEVMDQLLMKFQPGVLPHFFVLQTMANLASANVYGMVPFLKAVLGTLLPLLCSVKQENMKWIFAYALSKFSEAIIEYVSNVEKAPDPTVTKEAFQGEISSSYNVLFSSWLQSRESKVRSEVVLALGHMTHILQPAKVEELLPKFLPPVLAMYKKNQDYQYTTQGLCLVLDAAVANNSVVLESHLDSILSVLFPQICCLPDYSVPASVRNHNEILRCFAVLATVYADRLLTFLLQRLESSNEPYKIGALTVIKHLINSSNVVLQNKMPSIINGLKSVLDSGNKVKKVTAQVIVALAHHGYLKKDGGPDMVWFIVTQCALPDDHNVKRPTDPGFVSNDALRGMCENVMQLLTTTVENMSEVLWLCLFDCLMSENLTSAIGPVCKSLAFLANKKKEESGSDFTIDYNSFVDVTTPQVLLARLMVLVGNPLVDRNRGLYILNLLKAISPAISKNLQALWDMRIPPLLQCLENTDAAEWNQSHWESEIVEFFNLTLGEYDREEWTLKLGSVFMSQFPLYVNSPNDKYILLKFLGIIMKRVTNKSFIEQCLGSIFKNVNYHNEIERRGCAVSVGYCAATHLDLVLVKLEQTAKDDRKSSGLLSFIMDFRNDADHEMLIATIILCYGYVTMNGPTHILATRIETPILRSVIHFYTSSKDPLVKQTTLETIKLIAEAVHPTRMGDGFTFRSRNDLLSLMKNILKAEASVPITNSVRHLALSACANLIALDPFLKDDEKCSLIEVSVNSVYSLPKEIPLSKPKEETPEPSIDIDQLVFSALDALNLLLENLLLKQRTQDNLQTMFQILCVWINSRHDIERERCMNSVLHLIRSYAKATENEGFSPFTSLGFILGILVPRCSDHVVTVCHLAFDSIEAVLNISLRLQAPNPSSPSEESGGLSLNYMKQQVSDSTTIYNRTKDLGTLISEKLPAEQLTLFLQTLVKGLRDPHSQSSSGASVVLNRVLKLRGRELRHDAASILECIREQLPSIRCVYTRKGTYLTIQNLAIFHPITVLSSLLSSPLPLNEEAVNAWKILAREESLASLVIDHCIEVLSDVVIALPPDPHGRNPSPIAVFKPLAVVCALKEIFEDAEVTKCCKEKFDQIFSVLLLVIGQYERATPPSVYDEVKRSNVVISRKNEPKVLSVSPVKCAVEALKNFLICSQEDKLVSMLVESGDWLALEDAEKYHEAVASLSRGVCEVCPDYVPKIMSYMNPMLNNSMESHRVITVALFMEFLRQNYKGQKILVEPLINNLLGRLSDPSRIVRRLCIRGLGSMGRLFREQGQRYSTALLSAMMAGLDDKDDPNCDITLEAMNGLSAIIPIASEEDVQKIMINLAVKLRQMFEKEKASVRAAAFLLFGNLGQYGSNILKEQFVDQIHTDMVTLLLHLNDEDKQVIKSCKYALRHAGSLLPSKDMNEMFQKHLLENGHLHYGEFLNSITKFLISDFTDRIEFYCTSCLPYLRSPFPVIQCNAAAFLGYFLGNMPPNQRSLVPKEKICSALAQLLKDPAAEVRIRTAESLSLLYEY